MDRAQKSRSSSRKRPRLEQVSKTFEKIVTMFDKFGDDLWELCPLDKSHYAKKKDMKQHFIDCKKQFLKSPQKAECPYNPLHIINLMEIEGHMMTCENRVTVLNSGVDFEPKRELIEGVRMEPINTAPTFDTYWENDDPVEASYDPMDSTKFRSVMRAVRPGLSKKQRKEHRAKERYRWKCLEGETKEKPRPLPYPSPDEIKARKTEIKTEATIKEEASVMDSIIDGLNGAKISDPRNAKMKQINARLKIVHLMRIKLKEEEIALQRLVEEYVGSIGETNDDTNGDPRCPTVIAEITAVTANVDPRTVNADHASRVLPNIMASTMIR